MHGYLSADIIRAYFYAKWRLLSLLSFKYFSQRSRFWKLGNIRGYSPVLAGEYSIRVWHCLQESGVNRRCAIKDSLPLASFLLYSLSIGNYTAFLVQFGINLHEWVFQKVEIARAASMFINKSVRYHALNQILNSTGWPRPPQPTNLSP